MSRRRPWALLALLAAAQAPPPQSPPPQTPPPQTPAPQTPAPQSAPSPPDAWLPRGAADLILLEKLRGQPTTLALRNGQTAPFGTLAVTLRACFVRPADVAQNATAFLEVTDSRNSAPVFRGWVFSTTPALTQFEHPVYDLRLAACK